MDEGLASRQRLGARDHFAGQQPDLMDEGLTSRQSLDARIHVCTIGRRELGLMDKGLISRQGLDARLHAAGHLGQ